MEIYERIKIRRKEIGLSAESVAEQLGVSPATIYRYENQDIKKFPTDIIEPLARVLKTTPAYLMGWDDESRLKEPVVTDTVISFPIMGTIAAGYDELAVEDWSGDTIEIPQSLLKGRGTSDFFVLSIHGNSMYPMYVDGDKVLILKQSTLDNSGDIGAIVYENDCATLKKIEYTNGEDWLRLVPLNPEYMPKTLAGADLEQCKVIGVPFLLIRDLTLNK